MREIYHSDHLGNIRLSYADIDGNGSIDPASEILEENNYYPFGMKHQGYNEVFHPQQNIAASKYKYSGKEWNDELDLNLYDFHARNYDPAIGRWLSVDPLAEQFPGWTPYNYTMNNPIMFIDPTGMEPEGLDHDYRLGRNGKMTLVNKTNDNFDRIYNADGTDNITVSKEFNNFSYNSSSGKSRIHPMFDKDVQSGGGKSIFKFFADNTDVEIGYSEFKNNKKGHSFGFLITSNENKTIYDVPETINQYMSDKNISLTYNTHSHPQDYDAEWYHYGTTPSGFIPTLKLDTSLRPGVNSRTKEVEGDRAVYKGLKERFGSRIPAYFDLYTPKAPSNINVKYNDRTAIRKSN